MKDNLKAKKDKVLENPFIYSLKATDKQLM